MNINLIGLLAKGSTLVNLYTGDKYSFIEQEADTQFIKVKLFEEEKWNKYKLIYEVEPAKELRVDASELVPGDMIPFVNLKGKKMFDVRNMDIVTYTRNKETIKVRVIFLEKGKEDKDTVFTFVDQNGNDISDTGSGYTVEQFANNFNTKRRAVKRISVEDGFFAEVDRRFNEVNKTDPFEKKKVKKVDIPKEDKPLTISGLRNRLTVLGFYYKDEVAHTILNPWKKIVRKEKEILVTEDFVKQVISDRDMDRIERLKFIEAYNIARQLYVHDVKHKYQVELGNIKHKASIDVTEEEKAFSQQNMDRLEAEIESCDKMLTELHGYRKSIIEDLKKEVAHNKAEKRKNKKPLFTAKVEKKVNTKEAAEKKEVA